jgi:predicted hydrocarbon binding protein
MGKNAKQGMIRTIEGCIGSFAGESIRKKVVDGSEQINEKTDKKEIAKWVKCAMERLDALVDERTRFQIMENCGYKCAEVNKRVIERAKARLKKYSNIEDFLEAEQRNPIKGTSLVREGNTLYQFHKPQSLRMKCYCSLVNSAEEKISPTYCHCSKGFVKKLWESILERPVNVDLIQSVMSGANECKFAIHLQAS